MEPKALVYRTLDELVFENRNRTYGAYVLRRSYNDKVLLGFGVSVALVMILLFFPKDGERSIVERDFVFEGGTIILDPPPVLDFPKPNPPVQQPTVRTQNDNLPPIVTTDVVPDEPLVEAPTTSSPSDGSVVGGENSLPVSGMGDDIVMSIPNTEQPDFVLGAEVQPYYEGGFEAMMRFIRSKLKYPMSAKRLEIEGTVFVSFIINGDGSVRNVEVIRGFHPDCDKEAARVIAMLPGWIGGRQAGVPVAVKMALPIKFALSK